jgi:hypothetical protein
MAQAFQQLFGKHRLHIGADRVVARAAELGPAAARSARHRGRRGSGAWPRCRCRPHAPGIPCPSLESSPMSWRATRPSWVSTSSPPESMSSRPARHQALELAAVKEAVARCPRPVLRGLISVMAGCVAVLGLAADIADRLVEQDGDLVGLLKPWACLSTSMRTSGGDLHAHGATSPLTLTQPLAIQSSASRREAKPSSAMRLFRRTVPLAPCAAVLTCSGFQNSRAASEHVR